MSDASGVLTARLHGEWQDRSLDYLVSVRLEPDAIRIVFNGAPPRQIELPLGELTGAVFEFGALTLHPRDAAPVVLSDSPHLLGLRHRIEAQVCVFPAQTLSLRHFGSERSAPGSDHDRWFDALLTARRVSEESRTAETQRRAFDAGRLLRHAQQTREAYAAERFTAAADRRALDAELEELCAPYTKSVQHLEQESLRLLHADEKHQFDLWRAWTGTVQHVFQRADDAWAAMIPALVDSRGAQGSLWRRILRRSDPATS
jgi:hypothetical protein